MSRLLSTVSEDTLATSVGIVLSPLSAADAAAAAAHTTRQAAEAAAQHQDPSRVVETALARCEVRGAIPRIDQPCWVVATSVAGLTSRGGPGLLGPIAARFNLVLVDAETGAVLGGAQGA